MADIGRFGKCLTIYGEFVNNTVRHFKDRVTSKTSGFDSDDYKYIL